MGFYDKEFDEERFIMRIVYIVSIVICSLLLLFGSTECISSGHRGVVKTLGKVGHIMDEGIHLKWPIIQSVVEFEVRVQKEESEISASTKDLQDVSFQLAINYKVEATKVNDLYQKIGRDYRERVIQPGAQEVIKAISAKFTAQDLIVKRSEVSEFIQTSLAKRLKPYYVVIVDFSIINFKFSEEFTKAIEAKQTAEQMALKAQRDVERVKQEAIQKIEEAKAEAKALRLKRSELTRDLVQLEAIKKWDGSLPQYVGGSGSMPFVKLK